MELAQVVYSTKGHDKRSYYIVVEIVSDDRVKIADGGKRSINNAKLKNVKHLRTNGDILPKVAQKLENNTKVFDDEIASALRVYNYKQ